MAPTQWEVRLFAPKGNTHTASQRPKFDGSRDEIEAHLRSLVTKEFAVADGDVRIKWNTAGKFPSCFASTAITTSYFKAHAITP